MALAKLSEKKRAALPRGAFVFPERRAWPIDTKARAKTALSMSWWPGNIDARCKVQRAVVAKYPSLRRELASQRRRHKCGRSCRCG